MVSPLFTNPLSATDFHYISSCYQIPFLAFSKPFSLFLECWWNTYLGPFFSFIFFFHFCDLGFVEYIPFFLECRWNTSLGPLFSIFFLSSVIWVLLYMNSRCSTSLHSGSNFYQMPLLAFSHTLSPFPLILMKHFLMSFFFHFF